MPYLTCKYAKRCLMIDFFLSIISFLLSLYSIGSFCVGMTLCAGDECSNLDCFNGPDDLLSCPKSLLHAYDMLFCRKAMWHQSETSRLLINEN